MGCMFKENCPSDCVFDFELGIVVCKKGGEDDGEG